MPRKSRLPRPEPGIRAVGDVLSANQESYTDFLRPPELASVAAIDLRGLRRRGGAGSPSVSAPQGWATVSADTSTDSSRSACIARRPQAARRRLGGIAAPLAQARPAGAEDGAVVRPGDGPPATGDIRRRSGAAGAGGRRGPGDRAQTAGGSREGLITWRRRPGAISSRGCPCVFGDGPSCCNVANRGDPHGDDASGCQIEDQIAAERRRRAAAATLEHARLETGASVARRRRG